MAATTDIFDAAFLRQLQGLDAALMRLRGQSGEGLSKRGKSSGQHDFRGHRPYAPGDDLRRLDWNAYGRLGKFFMREFERERTEHLALLLDTSRSMAPGGKHVLARRAAAAAGYLALRRGGTVTLPGQPAIEGEARFGRLLDSLRGLEPVGGPMADQLAAMAARPRPPADLLVIGDGLEPLESLQPLALLSERRCAVTLLLVLSRQELNPTTRGAASLRGLEEGDTVDLELGEDLVAAYRAELQRHLDGIELLARRHGWTLAVTDSEADLTGLFLDKLAGVAA